MVSCGRRAAVALPRGGETRLAVESAGGENEVVGTGLQVIRVVARSVPGDEQRSRLPCHHQGGHIVPVCMAPGLGYDQAIEPAGVLAGIGVIELE